jgi:hypothetical protein
MNDQTTTTTTTTISLSTTTALFYPKAIQAVMKMKIEFLSPYIPV